MCPRVQLEHVHIGCVEPVTLSDLCVTGVCVCLYESMWWSVCLRVSDRAGDPSWGSKSVPSLDFNPCVANPWDPDKLEPWESQRCPHHCLLLAHPDRSQKSGSSLHPLQQIIITISDVKLKINVMQDIHSYYICTNDSSLTQFIFHAWVCMVLYGKSTIKVWFLSFLKHCIL